MTDRNRDVQNPRTLQRIIKKGEKKKSNLPLNFKTTHENFYLIAHYFSGKETKTKTEHFSLLETSKEMGVIANAVELFLR